MTSTADIPRRRGVGGWLRLLLLPAVLALCALQTPLPWGFLWLLVPASVATALLVSWRWGPWGVAVPVALFTGAMALAGPFSLWVWWIPVAALTGAWMGLREEGGGPPAGYRAWMLLPLLLLATALPWMLHFGELVSACERALKAGNVQALALYREMGYAGERLQALERSMRDGEAVLVRALPRLLPTALFVWATLMVAAGRRLAGGLAPRLQWPQLSRASVTEWRLPDGALWLLIAGLGLLVARWPGWDSSGWTLLINVGLGYCLQGIGVVESLLLARGVSHSIIALTLLFVFAMATPVFVFTTLCVGLSDAWLDYRRLEASPDGGSS